jgi:hypothetical protein
MHQKVLFYQNHQQNMFFSILDAEVLYRNPMFCFFALFWVHEEENNKNDALNKAGTMLEDLRRWPVLLTSMLTPAAGRSGEASPPTR